MTGYRKCVYLIMLIYPVFAGVTLTLGPVCSIAGYIVMLCDVA